MEDHADAKKAKNAAHPKTHSWGPFTILFRPAVGRSGKLTLAAWEATCRIKSHCVDAKCRKSVTVKANADEDVTLWRIRHWCNMGLHATNKAEHLHVHPSAKDLPGEDAIKEMCPPDDWSDAECEAVGEGTAADAAADGDAEVAPAL